MVVQSMSCPAQWMCGAKSLTQHRACMTTCELGSMCQPVPDKGSVSGDNWHVATSLVSPSLISNITEIMRPQARQCWGEDLIRAVSDILYQVVHSFYIFSWVMRLGQKI